MNYLTEFKYELEYNLDKTNIITDTLSRKIAITFTYMIKRHLLKRIKKGFQQDLQSQMLKELVKEDKWKRIWLKIWVFYTKRQHIFVLNLDYLQRDILKSVTTINMLVT